MRVFVRLLVVPLALSVYLIVAGGPSIAAASSPASSPDAGLIASPQAQAADAPAEFSIDIRGFFDNAFSFIAAWFSSRRPPTPPGGDTVPPGYFTAKDGQQVYLALGDSLAVSTGVANATNGYVSRFHGYLERESGHPYGLVNMGVHGESSTSIQGRQLEAAIDHIRLLRDDGDPATRVSVVTLDLGGNDILYHLASDECRGMPWGAQCLRGVNRALNEFAVNFDSVVSQIAAELEPGAEFYIMTVYNPFDLGLDLAVEDLSNEVVGQLNAVIRSTAEAHGATVADAFAVMNGRANVWTHILRGDIHPTDRGFQALAYSLVEAHRQRAASETRMANAVNAP
ncbi:MAG: SGNH/GDSL hydrolase family protein [Chloroflexi bacterium]|nr:SGNH/GDSL hydrolase family protein [Chloroflexota bacterium]